MRIILPTSFLWWTDVENKWKIELALFGASVSIKCMLVLILPFLSWDSTYLF